jgi:predicted nucleic acid-binding protein
LAIVDTSALYASLDRSDAANARCIEVLSRRDITFVLPTLVIAEVAHFAGTRLGPRAEAAFLRGMGALEIEPPGADDWPLIADLVERYADLGLGTTDAASIVLADRLETDLIVTLDRRHFGTVPSPAGRRFRLLPDPIGVDEEPAAFEAGSTR